MNACAFASVYPGDHFSHKRQKASCAISTASSSSRTNDRQKPATALKCFK